MRVAFVAFMAASCALAAEPKGHRFTFQKDDLGKLPPGWTAAKTGDGDGSVWKVTADDSTPSKTGHVLTQTAAGPNRLFNLCLLDKSEFGDGEITVRVKAVSGDIDQGGGLVWRYSDSKNYYVCRYNPLEKNFRLYYVKDGTRKELASKEKLEIPAGKWFLINVRHAGKAISCSLNGEILLTADDQTFAKPGQVGLWTKADAVTSFAELALTAGK